MPHKHQSLADQLLSHGTQGRFPRSKRQRTSRLGGKRKLDRLNVLFEAIEADKASDSETANGTDSRGSQGVEADSEPPTALQPSRATWAVATHLQDARIAGMPSRIAA